MLVDESISESINKYIHTLNIELQTELNSHGLTKEIIEDMDKNKITLGEEISKTF